MKTLLMLAIVTVALTTSAAESDPYVWLEEVTGDKALAWAEAHNALTVDKLATGESFQMLETRLRTILDSKDRIPYIRKAGQFYYNFWRDEANPRGLLRRTTLEEYRKAEPKWEMVLDVDALAKKEGENWVFKGIVYLETTYDRALFRLSRGGADAVVIREFDLQKKAFVEDGFNLPEAKGMASWAGRDRVFVATDFGPGTMTSSGYPRIVKLWQRGQPVEKAATIFEGEHTDVSVGAYADLTEGYREEVVYRNRDFYSRDMFVKRGDQLIKLDVPADAQTTVDRGWLSLRLKSDWTVGDVTYKTGSFVLTPLDDFLAGKRHFDVLFEPSPGQSLAGVSATLNHVLINVLDDVRNRVYVWKRVKDKWVKGQLLGSDGFQTISVAAVDRRGSDDYLLQITDYVTPATLKMKTLGTDAVKVTKQAPALFDANGLEISQHWAESKDGTRIPYFQVAKSGVDKPQPTLLYGYGGFQSSLVPYYSATVGAGWLEPGGIYVVANIRGGGEFGPSWHQAALKENRHRAYEDFIAVAEDLIHRKVTTSRQLGVLGASNGGLLVGNMLTMRPDLFGAIVCQVALLDMRRYTKLLAGASWMAEYGNPDDPDEWRFIKTFSPYHNVARDVDYPDILFTTSTRDDRVHPAHTRKMVAKMEDLGHEVLYYENTEGGHAGAANNAQRAFMSALAYTFLWEVLN